jgi:cytidylate kinase
MKRDERGRTLVTLDGPAGVGKSTTARAVARELGYCYLDSGALYRAVTWALLERGVDPSTWDDLSPETLAGLGIRAGSVGPTLEIRCGDRLLMDELRTPEVTAAVSSVARVPAVRDWLLDAQRAAAETGGLVADGRDMGTVVFPEAWAKVFLQADVAERARRRLGDQGVHDPSPDELEAEAARLAERDRKDSEREVAPLRRPEGSLLVDATDLDFEEQVRTIVGYAREAARGKPRPVDGPEGPE